VFGNLSNRLTLFADHGAIDVEEMSGGRFGADPQAVYDRWDEFTEWVTNSPRTAGAAPYSVEDLGAPAPRPRQVFAIGANYRAHAAEGDFAVPENPMVFTKWPSSFTGPSDRSCSRGDGGLGGRTCRRDRKPGTYHSRRTRLGLRRRAHRGQDITERTVQLRDSNPQFSPSKSFPGFSPSGPWLVTLEDFVDQPI